jgi:3-oxoadipate enol-lactonase
VIPAHRLDGPEGAPVLVLPSSLGTTRELWAPQLDLFASELRVLRYEHRGHGESAVPPGPYAIAGLGEDALELLDALGLERVLWCGVSLGGMVGMWLGARAPERLDALVLACTSARVGAPDVYAERATFVRAHGLEPVANGVLARWLTAETRRTKPELVARLRAVLVAQPVEGYASCCEAIAAWDFRDELGEVAVPTLVVAGALDEATPAEQTELLAQRIPHARLAVLEGAGHLANLERPAEFAETALAHLLART